MNVVFNHILAETYSISAKKDKNEIHLSNNLDSEGIRVALKHVGSKMYILSFIICLG